jgi:hypothetical protein
MHYRAYENNIIVYGYERSIGTSSYHYEAGEHQLQAILASLISSW